MGYYWNSIGKLIKKKKKKTRPSFVWMNEQNQGSYALYGSMPHSFLGGVWVGGRASVEQSL